MQGGVCGPVVFNVRDGVYNEQISINNITGALDRAFMHMDADQNLFATTMDDQTAAAEAYLNKTVPAFKGD